MTFKDLLGDVRTIVIPKNGPPVVETAAREARPHISPSGHVRAADGPPRRFEEKTLYITTADGAWRSRLNKAGVEIPGGRDGVAVHVGEHGSVVVVGSAPQFLFAGVRFLIERLAEEPVSRLRRRFFPATFSVEKSTFDLFLTQYARTLRGFDRERYIREYARLGFTHIEVNALAAPFPYEQGVPGEFYPDFYTYCPALDQFVESRLNRGIYPREHLEANLARLKDNARLAVKYGLVPGLLCFEPRTVPEALFQKYPTLRGARVDHPFRSFKPRYTLSLVHPLAQKHYAELMANLMAHVPELEFISVWSNDSGSGFEHTKSLYVGRNGGAYMIREWKDDDAIASAAAVNIANFYRILRDAARTVNPKFRVITRLESFYGERRPLWPLLRDGIDVEVNSLLVTGWENNYLHPSYPDIQVLGSAYHNRLRDKEKRVAAELRARDGRAYFYHFMNSHGNHEPLLGIPFPWLTYEKLRSAAKLGLSMLAHMGGLQPPDKVPFAVNQEVFRRFQFDAGLDIDETVADLARSYVGGRRAAVLVRGWRLVERAIRNFVPMSLYSGFGTVWNRLLVRPFVPDIGRIPARERAYYENVMVSPIHNPNKVDLARDVLFELITKDYARRAFRRIDGRARAPLDRAVGLFQKAMTDAKGDRDGKSFSVFEDQYYRVTALRCLYETIRNAAVWIYAVHEYQDTRNPRTKARCRKLLDDMVGREIENSRNFARVWAQAPVEWMAVSGFGETPFIYGENFPELLKKKIRLMMKYRNDVPRIDPDYMFRVENDPYADTGSRL
jgi:hypothetical protein